MLHGDQANKIFDANSRLAKVIACFCMESSEDVNDIVSKISCALVSSMYPLSHH
jgi:hypothetical protein